VSSPRKTANGDLVVELQPRCPSLHWGLKLERARQIHDRVFGEIRARSWRARRGEGSYDDEARCDLGTGTLPRHLAWTDQSHANRMCYLACVLCKRGLREKSLFDDHASNGSTVSGHNRIDISNKTSTRNSMWQSLESNEDELSATPSTLTRGAFPAPIVRSRSITMSSQSPHFLYPTVRYPIETAIDTR
jgi:hypothetical protein